MASQPSLVPVRLANGTVAYMPVAAPQPVVMAPGAVHYLHPNTQLPVLSTDPVTPGTAPVVVQPGVSIAQPPMMMPSNVVVAQTGVMRATSFVAQPAAVIVAPSQSPQQSTEQSQQPSQKTTPADSCLLVSVLLSGCLTVVISITTFIASICAYAAPSGSTGFHVVAVVIAVLEFFIIFCPCLAGFCIYCRNNHCARGADADLFSCYPCFSCCANLGAAGYVLAIVLCFLIISIPVLAIVILTGAEGLVGTSWNATFMFVIGIVRIVFVCSVFVLFGTVVLYYAVTPNKEQEKSDENPDESVAEVAMVPSSEDQTKAEN